MPARAFLHAPAPPSARTASLRTAAISYLVMRPLYSRLTFSHSHYLFCRNSFSLHSRRTTSFFYHKYSLLSPLPLVDNYYPIKFYFF